MVAIKKIKVKKLRKYIHHKYLFLYLRAIIWFGIGVILGLFFLLSFAYIAFTQLYHQSVFPGVTIGGIAVGGKSEQYVENYFQKKSFQFAQ